jgi:sugar phosphate isomerase/epimerase
MTASFQISRRTFLTASAAAVAVCAMPALGLTTRSAQRYRISVCDWMILKRQKLGAIKLAAECGIEGVEVDLGGVGTKPDIDNKLRDEVFRKQYHDEAAKFGITFSSLALSGFYAQPIAEHPRAVDYAIEMLELLPKMGAKVGFLPFSGKTDLTDPATRAKVVERMKAVAPTAEKLGMTLGISPNQPAEASVKLLDDIGSPGVKIYYSTGDAVEAKRDVYGEMRLLGERISQIHLTGPDTAWLKDGPLDVPKVKSVLDDIGYHGWLVLERARMPGKSVKENYSANAAYLRSVFQGNA